MNITRHKIILTLILLLGIGFFACDNNIPRPDDLSADTSISIADFTVDEAVLTLGDSTMLRWEVEDDENKVDYVYISPDVGPKSALSGSALVTPLKSTTYKLTVYVDNDAVKTRSLIVTVITAEGDEVLEEPKDEVCTDGEDNDLDGATDCDDDDCAEDAACLEPETDYTINHSISPEAPYIGDTVTISWESECAYITITEVSGKYFEGNDAYEFNAEDPSTTFTLNCFDQDGKFQDSASIIVAAQEVVDETPTFSATVSFSILPSSSLIHGQKYTVSWSVDCCSASMDGNNGLSGTADYVAGVDGSTHQLTVTDKNGLEQTYTKSVTVKEFQSEGRKFDDTITKIIPGDDEGEFYFVSAKAVYFNNDYLESDPEKIVSSSDVGGGNIHAFAIKNSTYFIGTNQGVYIKEKDSEGSATQILSTYNASTVQALVRTNKGKILMGTDYNFYHIVASDSDDGYKVELKSLGGNSTIDISRFIRNPKSENQLFAITDAGTYYSNNGGDSFRRVLSSTQSVKDGSWDFDGSAFVWSDDKVYKWDGESFVHVPELEVSETVNYVIFQGGRYFVATDSDVHTYDEDSDTEIFSTGLGQSVRFLIDQGRTLDLDGDKFGLFDIKNITLAITSDGKKYTLEWGGNFLKNIINPSLRLTSILAD